MCTLSVILLGGVAFRVVHNRDELRTRSEGEAPAWRAIDGTGFRAVYPVDPDAGGTWIAARDDGVVYAILNVNPSAEGAERAVSRGRVILDLLGADADAPLRHAESERMRSYRVVRVRPSGVGVVVDEHRSFGADSASASGALTEPRVWVSSGLGDERVEPRVPLFAEVVGADPTRAAQDRYHRHVWADRPEISVLMSRADARTTGITTVESGPDGVEMRYEPVAGNRR